MKITRLFGSLACLIAGVLLIHPDVAQGIQGVSVILAVSATRGAWPIPEG